MTDLKRAFRSLHRKPGFTILAVWTLALGIGATTTLYSVVESVLWRPLPFVESDRLVSVLEGQPGEHQPTSPVIYSALREWAESLVDVTATHAWDPVLRGMGNPTEVRGLRTTAGLFDLLGSRAELGRRFEPTSVEGLDGDPRVVVVSHGLWQRELSGDRDVLGRQISLDGESYTVVAVMPPDFGFPTFWVDEAELWVPFVPTPEQLRSNAEFLRVFARLAPGVPVETAQEEIDLIAQGLERENPDANEGLQLQISPLLEPTVGHARTALWVLFGMVGLVLSIACANVAGLFLARAAGRRREIAVRLAIGAGHGRVLRQMLTEGLLLAGVGGILGLLLSAWGIEALRILGPDDVPRLAEVRLHPTGIAVTGFVSVLAGTLFGLLPSLTLRGWDLRGALQQGTRSGAGSGAGGGRLRRSLVVVQVAFTVALLVGAGLLARSFHHLAQLDPGFEREGILTLQVSLQGTEHAEPESQNAFFEAVLDEAEPLPGVRHVGWINHLPVGDDIWTSSFRIVGRPEPGPGETPGAVIRVAGPETFDALGLRVLAGRAFTEADHEDAARVALVNRSLARRYFAEDDPVGHRFRRGDEEAEWTIVGVVEDVRQWTLTQEIQPEIVYPYAQNPVSFWTKASLVVRTAGDPEALIRPLQERIWALDPEVSISDVRSMDALLADSIGDTRFQTFVLGLFALLAVVLSMVGIYGVMSYLVAWRRADIGVRMAVGASRESILGWVLGDGLRLTAWGALLGLALAWPAGKAMTDLLHGVEPGDVLTLAVTVLGLLFFAATATLVPALRAARLQPLECLRDE